MFFVCGSGWPRSLHLRFRWIMQPSLLLGLKSHKQWFWWSLHAKYVKDSCSQHERCDTRTWYDWYVCWLHKITNDAVLGDYCVDIFQWRFAEEGHVSASWHWRCLCPQLCQRLKICTSRPQCLNRLLWWKSFMFAWNAQGGIPTGAGLVMSCCLRDAKKWCKRDLVHSLSMTSKLYACFQLFSNAFCQGGNAYCNFSAVSALKRTVEINSQSRSSSVVVTAATSEGASCKAQRLAAAHHVLHSQTYCRLQVWPVFMCR